MNVPVNGQILVGGRPVTVLAPVRTWYDSGLGFPALGLRTETKHVVCHWTGGEGGGPQVHATLKERGLSVQFLVDQDGLIWQYADASARCAHAGSLDGLAHLSANAASVGIEIVNRACLPLGRWPRETYPETVHGKTFKATTFLPAQVSSVKALVGALCSVYGLPLAAPTSSTVLSEEAFKQWRGVLGHYHLTRRKLDPGPRLFRDLGLSLV